MRRMGLIKRGLVLALCGMLAAPAVGMLWEPMVVEAIEGENSDIDFDLTPADSNYKGLAIRELKQYYLPIQKTIQEAGNKDKADAVISDTEAIINQADISKGAVDLALSEAKAKLDSYKVKDEQPVEPTPDPEPETTNNNIMVGGNWVTQP